MYNRTTKALIGSLALIGISVLGYGCGPDHKEFNRCDVKYFYQPQTKYDVVPDIISDDNIAIDRSGLPINSKRIDRIVNELETCLIATFGNPPTIPEQTMKDGGCSTNTFDLPLHRECFVVKIAADCFMSEYSYGGSYQQLLPYIGGLCKKQKDLPGDPNELCYWRVGKQDHWTSATCPSDYVLKEPLLEYSTGCRSPWYDNSLANCMSPSSQTGPLDDGSGP